MERQRSKMVRLVVAGALGALLGAAVYGGVAIAVHDANTIHACVHNGTGRVRIVQDTNQCHSANEKPAEWNIVGPQGPAGEPGEDGEPGVSGWEIVRETTAVDAGDATQMFAHCPFGKRAIGGGFSHQLDATLVRASVPSEFSPEGNAWRIFVRNTHATLTDNVTVHAVCAFV